MEDVAPYGDELAAWGLADRGRRDAADPRRRCAPRAVGEAGVSFEIDRPVPADPARRERLDAVTRWYAQDWLTIDAKLRSSIFEGLSVFLSVFDLPDVATTFVRPSRPSRRPRRTPARLTCRPPTRPRSPGRSRRSTR